MTENRHTTRGCGQKNNGGKKVALTPLKSHRPQYGVGARKVMTTDSHTSFPHIYSPRIFFGEAAPGFGDTKVIPPMKVSPEFYTIGIVNSFVSIGKTHSLYINYYYCIKNITKKGM